MLWCIEIQTRTTCEDCSLLQPHLKKKKKNPVILKQPLHNFIFLCRDSPKQEEVRPQDTVSVIGGVAGSSKQGRKAAWKFVKENWEQLFSRYQGGFLISRLVKVDRCLLGWVGLTARLQDENSTRVSFLFWFFFRPLTYFFCIHSSQSTGLLLTRWQLKWRWDA